MSLEATLILAYAFATQERYEEAEGFLHSCPEAAKTPLGRDLLARIRYAQNRLDEARSIWQRLLDEDPTNESARKAIEAIDEPGAEPTNPHRKVRLAMLAFAALVVMVIVLAVACRCGHRSVTPAALGPSVVGAANKVENVEIKENIKTSSAIAGTNRGEWRCPVVAALDSRAGGCVMIPLTKTEDKADGTRGTAVQMGRPKWEAAMQVSCPGLETAKLALKIPGAKEENLPK